MVTGQATILVSIRIQDKAHNLNNGRYKVNGQYLQEKPVVTELVKQWQSLPVTLGFFGKLWRIVKWYQTLCVQQAQERHAVETELRHHLAGVQAAL
jgi:hypothetical protein